jgi:hypothetical protein
MTAKLGQSEDSNSIQHVAYHNHGLEITFTSGRTYRYDAPPTVYYELSTSLSKGKYFNKRVRTDYPCYEVPLRRSVQLAFRAYAVTHRVPYQEPRVSFLGSVILVNDHPYGGGAAAVSEFFTSRAEKWLSK